MRAVVQRVLQANVSIQGITTAEIEKGLLVFIGIGKEDNVDTADKMVRKIIQMRIFEDQDGKTNLDLYSVDGEVMLISQFTLYANCKKGNRPSFIEACPPQKADELYQYMIDRLKEEKLSVKQGEFGADMKVSLINDGPFTIYLDSESLLS